MHGEDNWLNQLSFLESCGRRRSLRTLVGAPDRIVNLDGRRLCNFSSNNYLGLANHAALANAAIEAIERVGLGSGASRLIVGNHDVHELMEKELADFHKTPAALLFNSGYHANIGTVQSLVGKVDVVFSDQLNHASIIDGCRLSGAQVVVYPHGDVATLTKLLGKHIGRQRLVVTDSVFSMDGDCAPLAELSQLCAEYEAVLMVDEAHATGVLGPEGRGMAADIGAKVDVRVGTLGKAFGSLGAYVAGSEALTELLLNRARSFVFTTALPPSIVAASRAALRLIRGAEGERRRRQLSVHVARFREGLRSLGLLAPGAGTTPIFPVIIGDEDRTMECSERMCNRGIYAQGIRPPTVPRGTSRLRFALMATHTEEDLDRALGELEALVHAGLISRKAE